MPDRPLILLIAGLILGAAVFLRPSIHGTDGVCHYVYARSAIFDGDLDFTNDYAAFQSLRQYPYPFSRAAVPPATGRPDNSYGPGAAILWSPFILGARAALRVAGRGDLDTGYTSPFEWAVGLATSFWASLGLILVYVLLRRLGIGEWPALGGVAALWLCTPLFFYMYLHPSMSHGVSFFAAALALTTIHSLWCSSLGKAPPGNANLLIGHYLAVGASLGLVILIRMQDVPLAFCLAAAALWPIRPAVPPGPSTTPASQLRLLLRLAALAAGVIILFLPQLLVWHSIYGSIWRGPQNYLGQGRSAWPRYFFQAWFSPHHGLFYWHPILLAGLAGLLLWRSNPPWLNPIANRGEANDTARAPASATRLLRLQLLGLVVLIAQTFLIGSWWSWHGGASFGHRMFVSALPFFSIGIAVVLAAASSRAANQAKPIVGFSFGAAAGMALAAALYWNLGLAWLYGKNLIPRDAPVSWGQMLRGLLIDLPRALLG